MFVISFQKLRSIIYKIVTIAEKNTLMLFRFKYGVIISFITPLISILIPVLVFGKIFEFTSEFGPWTTENYIVFIMIGYCILLLRRMMQTIPGNLHEEKYWKTLPAIIIAPFNRYYLLLGYFFSELIMLLIPFLIFLIILLVIFPISFITLIFIILNYLAISISFAGIGLVLGVFAISNENIWGVLKVIISLIIWASCITYPFELFPAEIQFFIKLNPIYYMIDLLRLFWINDNIIVTLSTNPLHVFIVVVSSVIIPIIGVLIFNYIYKKLGVSGY